MTYIKGTINVYLYFSGGKRFRYSIFANEKDIPPKLCDALGTTENLFTPHFSFTCDQQRSTHESCNLHNHTGQSRVDLQNGNTFENVRENTKVFWETCRVSERKILTIAYHQHLCSIIILPSYALHGVRVENERGHR